MTTNKNYTPIAVFDTLEEVINQYKVIYVSDRPQSIITDWLNSCFASQTKQISIPTFAANDYQIALNFLHNYRGSADTFGAYRRDLERLLQWSWFIRNQSILGH